MNVLFDVNHPAHVHLFRNAIDELQADGARTLVTSRYKDLTTRLLDEYGIDHRPLSEHGDGLASLVAEWALREWRLLRVALSFDPDVLVGRLNPPLVHVSRVLGVPNVVFMDTEIKSSVLDRCYSLVTEPFVDVYCTPPGLKQPNADARHCVVDFQELAYLHPNRFTPDPELLRSFGIEPGDTYFVVRFAAWDAFHDISYSGFSTEARRELVSSLSERGDVYITSEDPLPEEFAPYRLPVPPHLVHHLLYYADLYVGDSGTMSSEAAILGTPAVRTNSMVADDTESIFAELEDQYGLLWSFADERRALDRVAELVESGTDDERWRRKRDELVADKSDVTARMVKLIGEVA